jgi:hypothetical protein
MYIYRATGCGSLITGLGRKCDCCWTISEMHLELTEVHPVSHVMNEADRVFILTFYLHPVPRSMLHATLFPNSYKFSVCYAVQNIVLHYKYVFLCFMLIIFINCNWVVIRWHWLFNTYTKHEIGSTPDVIGIFH